MTTLCVNCVIPDEFNSFIEIRDASFHSSLCPQALYLLANGVLQILLQPFGLGIDADLPVVLQLGSRNERVSRVSGRE